MQRKLEDILFNQNGLKLIVDYYESFMLLYSSNLRNGCNTKTSKYLKNKRDILANMKQKMKHSNSQPTFTSNAHFKSEEILKEDIVRIHNHISYFNYSHL